MWYNAITLNKTKHTQLKFKLKISLWIKNCFFSCPLLSFTIQVLRESNKLAEMEEPPLLPGENIKDMGLYWYFLSDFLLCDCTDYSVFPVYKEQAHFADTF